MASLSQLQLPNLFGWLFSFLEQKSTSKVKKRAILHTFQTHRGAATHWAPRHLATPRPLLATPLVTLLIPRMSR